MLDIDIKCFIVFYFMFWWVISIITKDNLIQNTLEGLGQWIAYKRENNTDFFLFFFGTVLASLVYYASRNFYFMIPFMPVLFLVVVFRIKKIGLLFINLSGCMFCIENHTATLMAIGYAYYCQDIRIAAWGFLCASINSWLSTFLK